MCDCVSEIQTNEIYIIMYIYIYFRSIAPESEQNTHMHRMKYPKEALKQCSYAMEFSHTAVGREKRM